MHDEQGFNALIEPHRRELPLHCYRMLGSLQDAEDAVQETLVSAWRGIEGFQEKSSLRTWLYRIATNRCLNMIRDHRRRPAADLPFVPPPPTRTDEVTWLEPYPDDLLPDTEPEPQSRYELKEAVGLAFITALQRLPVTQRTVLVLSEDAWVTMPPEPLEYQGHAAIAEFLAHGQAFRAPGARVRLLPTRANAAPAFGHYMEQEPGSGVAHGLGVFALVLDGQQIARLTRFGTPELLPRFGLPLDLRLD